MTVLPNWRCQPYFVVNLFLALGLVVGSLLFAPATSVSAARTFYVSRHGNNRDGLSWATAWNELSRINWGVVAPGDTIVIDGGPTACPALGPGYNCGMVYNSTLSVGKSGTSGAPITIRLAGEAGRNGTVIIDGGITAWAGCAEYPSEPRPPSTPNGAGVRDTGITLNSAQWIILDGRHWGGIEVRNHTRYGLSFGSSQRVVARYLKLHHNTHPSDTTNGAAGVAQSWDSQYNTLSRTEIFRNGQDGVRGAGDFFTLEQSYIHDHYCNHPDGIQSFVPTSNDNVPDNAGEVRGLVLRGNVFNKIGMQTVFLGENDTHNSWNVDVTITNNLFLNNDYVIKSKHGGSRNWNIYNNTIVNAGEFAVEWCCSTPGSQAPMSIRDNVFVNVKESSTAFYLPTGSGNTGFNNNCLYRTGRRQGNISESGTVTADPRFVSAGTGNYALASGSACAGKGASLTSVSQLVGLGCAAAQGAALIAESQMEGLALDESVETPTWPQAEVDALLATLAAETGLPEGIVEMGPFDVDLAPAESAEVVVEAASVAESAAVGPYKIFFPHFRRITAPTFGC
jgi:hypothetical protein